MLATTDVIGNIALQGRRTTGGCIGLLLGLACASATVPSSTTRLWARSEGVVSLERRRTDVDLKTFSDAAPRAGERVFLILTGPHADAAPGAIYQIYLDLPRGEPPRANDPHYAGTLNFFGAVKSESRNSVAQSFDVTEVLIHTASSSSSIHHVTFLASRAPRAGSHPRLTSISLQIQLTPSP